jgi:soluble lytic murein transglycosylase-like protein
VGRVPFQSADILPHLIQQESGGRAGVSGPQTQYGQAQGMTQVLPSTAQGLAKRLGVPYRADLMSGTSEAARQYQSAIGQAYLDEALDKTGNVTDALKYYHGGPNRRIWGPKTNAYANGILRRLGV